MRPTFGNSRSLLAILPGVAAIVIAVAPRTAAAQRPATDLPPAIALPAPTARVMLLGTFHFDNPGRDAYRPRFGLDVLAPERQRELEDVVARLAEYKPTRIAVEWNRARQAQLDSLYAEYRAGRLDARASEVYQLGFRLAARLGHERVYAVNTERHEALLHVVDSFVPDFERADTADAWRVRYRRVRAWDDSMKTTRTLAAQLRCMNDPATIRRDHGSYLVGFLTVGGDTSYVGPDFIAGWYDRNLRIFRNLQRITSRPDERLLVVYGAGHLATLRHFVESSPEYRLVEVGEYLGG
ncbi:MAG TPA: DUF5694 domain-containing protein [Gemmatimonadaceae bacterium]|nr:DUF5694 domain-containing protein [Gemmatimonadaceae bacterium]